MCQHQVQVVRYDVAANLSAVSKVETWLLSSSTTRKGTSTSTLVKMVTNSVRDHFAGRTRADKVEPSV
ncbi:hypothetical protein ACJIZ3_003461 [Penstemon smallii]|uniref:Uncharacterized protein n=1 Tax=Penstemon smallii TaxID=265156 RepID=A0ABD3UCB0_9LAMI